MRKTILFLLCALSILAGIIYVVADDSHFITTTASPSAYSTSTSTSVLYNLTANWTGSTVITANKVNCSLYIKNSTAGSYVQNTTTKQLINTTATEGYINVTLVMPDKHRYWSYWSCKNDASVAVGNSTPVIIDVDTTYDLLSLGANGVINMSTTTGNIVTIGSITASGMTIDSLKLTNASSTATASEGKIFFNTTSKQFVGWNGTAWSVLG